MAIQKGSIVQEKTGRKRVGVVLNTEKTKIWFIGKLTFDAMSEANFDDVGSGAWWRVIGEEIGTNSSAHVIVKFLG